MKLKVAFLTLTTAATAFGMEPAPDFQEVVPLKTRAGYNPKSLASIIIRTLKFDDHARQLHKTGTIANLPLDIVAQIIEERGECIGLTEPKLIGAPLKGDDLTLNPHDHTLFAVRSKDLKGIELGNIDTPDIRRTLSLAPEYYRFFWHPTKVNILVCYIDKKLILCDISTHTLEQTFSATFDDLLDYVACNPHNPNSIAAISQRHIYLYDTSRGKQLSKTPLNTPPIDISWPPFVVFHPKSPHTLISIMEKIVPGQPNTGESITKVWNISDPSKPKNCNTIPFGWRIPMCSPTHKNQMSYK